MCAVLALDECPAMDLEDFYHGGPDFTMHIHQSPGSSQNGVHGVVVVVADKAQPTKWCA